MAGLSLNDGSGATPTVLKRKDANNEVTVTFTAGAWGSSGLEITPGSTDGWSLFGPSNHPAGLVLSGGATVLENKTFTPKIAGRYTIVLKATNSETEEQERYSAVYEVGTAHALESIPSPQEKNEYGASTGWARAYEERFRALDRVLGARILVRAQNSSGAGLVQGDIVSFVGYNRTFAAASNANFMADYMGDIAMSAEKIDATDAASIGAYTGWVVDSTVADGEYFTAVYQGFIPFNTTAWVNPNDFVYLSDTSTLGSVAGTNLRIVGTVVKVAAATMSTVAAGAILFNGDPNAFPQSSGSASKTLTVTTAGFAGTIDAELLDAGTGLPGGAYAAGDIDMATAVAVTGGGGDPLLRVELWNGDPAGAGVKIAEIFGSPLAGPISFVDGVTEYGPNIISDSIRVTVPFQAPTGSLWIRAVRSGGGIPTSFTCGLRIREVVVP